jgi:hypothetical protein
MRSTTLIILAVLAVASTAACLPLDDINSGPAAGQQVGRFQGGEQHGRVFDLAATLAEQAVALATESFEHFKGWNGTISDQEQAILFRSESFAASCRLFIRLAEGQSDFYRADNLRTNLYNAFAWLTASFTELENEMRRGNVMPYSLSECRNLLGRMEREFRGWASPDNLAYLDGRYVKGADATVYLIQRQGVGQFTRRPFKSLESLFRYNFNENRGKDPWKYLVEVSEDTLRKMRGGPMIALTFEGQMIIEQGNRPNRPVYRIENGRKRGLTQPDLVTRFGGWSRVFEVPREVIDAYEEGAPIDRS